VLIARLDRPRKENELPEKVIIGDAELWLCDCREVLPMLTTVCAIVTDPPYGLGDKWQGGGGGKKSSWAFDPSEAMAWDGNTVEGLEDLINPFHEAIVWGGNYYSFGPSRCWLIWDKKQNDQWTTAQCEMAWTSLDRTVRAFRFAQCEQANEGAKLHPTQKPLALMEWCLKWVVSEMICDPFMGSGTTGVAAINLGRKFIGIEREPKYFEIACKRISHAVEQSKQRLFGPEPEPQPETPCLGLDGAV